MNQSSNKVDRAILAEQESQLVFEAFSKVTAWEIGSELRRQCDERGVATAIEIRMSRKTVFFTCMEGASSNNTDWARRKRNTVELMDQSSYLVGLSLEKGETLQHKTGLALRDFSSFGGAFPVRVKGVGVVGVITVSGLPQRDDHSLIVEVLVKKLNLTGCNLELPVPQKPGL